MVIKTENQIKKMIQKLREEKKLLPNFSFFGDDNWDMYDCAISVLTRKLTENELYNKKEYYKSELSEDFAIVAACWLEGNAEDSELIED